MNNLSEKELLEIIGYNITQAKDVYYTGFFDNFRLEADVYQKVVFVLGAFIVIINFAVVISSGLILKNKQTRHTTYIFLGNVALSDLITGLAIVLENVYPVAYKGHYFCVFQMGMIVSSTLISVFSVGLIAIDRFLYIIHGLHYQKWVNPFRSKLLIVTTWIIGCIIGFMPLFGWHQDPYDGKWCWFVLITPRELLFFTVVVATTPLLTVVILYSIILYYALKKIIQLQESAEASTATQTQQDVPNLRMFRGSAQLNPQQVNVETNKPNCVLRVFKKKTKSSLPTKWKAIKVVLFTSCAFVLTWGPYFCITLYYVFTGTKVELNLDFHMSIAGPLSILGYVNGLVNPIIYAWWHRGFRTYIQTHVIDNICKKLTNKSPTVSSNNNYYTNEAVSLP